MIRHSGYTASDVENEKISSDLPVRLDRLPWSRWHWLVVVGLGTVWILDGLEVTLTGAMATSLSQAGSGLDITTAEVTGAAAALYITGACSGAVLFGFLTSKYGRRRLFTVTLVIYMCAAAATAVSTHAWWFFVFRFVTGVAIGGEYVAVNSCIDELMPSAHRGRIGLAVNSTFWLGALGGALLTPVLLDPQLFAPHLGWRLAFALGAVLGLAVLWVRRHVPESPRWLLSRNRVDEAKRIVEVIEARVQNGGRGRHRELPAVTHAVTVHRSNGSRPVGTTLALFRDYPSRAVLCLALFIGQSFLYNSVTFGFGAILYSFYDVPGGQVGYFLAAMCLGNLTGPVFLGGLFDSVGRRAMITATYLLSGVALLLTAALFANGLLNALTLTVCWCVVLFFASAGAASAYVTASEIFPSWARSTAIAVFYSTGTLVGGVSGPLVFASLTASGVVADAVLAFAIGAALMIVAGVVAAFCAVSAERRGLEEVAP